MLRRKRTTATEAPSPPKRRRLRRWTRLALILGAIAAVVLLYLYVEVTTRFEGRLWDLPSHVYSARLALSPGDALSPAELIARLDRCGYGKVEGRGALRPGQYRRKGEQLEVHRRAWPAAVNPISDLALLLTFQDGRLVGIRDGRRRRLDQVVFEPELLASLYGEQQEERDIVPLARVPKPLQDAVLAAEDVRFYHHWGIDPVAVVRAAFANVKSGHIVQGGSTIPMQTVKNLYHLGTERTWWRKIREVPMAWMLDLRYSKSRILEAYLNEVYLGQRGPVAVCGVSAASRFYFGRDLGDLTLGESALLAGMIRNPGGYNPFKHPQEALARRDRVLGAMEEEEMIDAEAARKAKAERLHLATGGGGLGRPSYVAAFVRAQLAETYSGDVLANEGLRIHTTVDTLLQDRAERALRDGLARLDRDMPSVRNQRRQRTLQGSLLALDPRTGAILAMVGGREFRDTPFNRAVQAKRQPGSCFKPFVYLTAFAAAKGMDGGITPASLLRDEPIEQMAGGRLWTPENYDHTFRGEVTAREALENSINIPTIEAAQTVGLKEVVATAHACGLPEMQPLPSVALGAQEVTPLELATAFATLSQNGLKPTPRILAEVLEADGTVVEHTARTPEQVVPPAAAYLVTDVLRGVLLRGTAASAWSLGFQGNAAGKTGTTDDTRDAWFVGYTPEFLALVWVGYDDNARTGLTGASGALPIWVDFMRRCGFPGGDRSFPEPEGVVHRVIDPLSGGIATGGCPTTVDEVFLEGTEPEEECPLHGGQGIWKWFKGLFD